jgi:Dna[CI] antecedent, DciA
VPDGDLSSFESSVDELFRRLGLPDPIVMSKITADWDSVAGEPWAGRSKPLFIQGRTLVVEASAPSMVAFLRYGSASLVTTIEALVGTGVIDRIDVRPPPRQ